MTGAGSGIGRALALALALEGMSIVGADLHGWAAGDGVLGLVVRPQFLASVTDVRASRVCRCRGEQRRRDAPPGSYTVSKHARFAQHRRVKGHGERVREQPARTWAPSTWTNSFVPVAHARPCHASGTRLAGRASRVG